MIYINDHEIVVDEQGHLQPWASYDSVVRIAMDFIRDCPIDPVNRLPWYLQYSCFWTDPLRPTEWPDNPAGKFAWAVTTLLKYYPYSGDAAHISVVRRMLDRLWEYRSPASSAWPDLPYASAHPGTGVYFGDRADGEYVTEPDKAAQVGRAYVDFYELTGEKKYLQIGQRIAQVLAQKIRTGDASHSPWPFRVDVRDGTVVEEYSSHFIPAVRLYDELIRLGEDEYQSVRNQIWTWLETYPLVTNLWKGHFEDIRLDPANENRDQLAPLETARYILQNKEQFPDRAEMAERLITWVRTTLGGHPFFNAIPIHEQKFCNFPMGSHTARYASLCAMVAEETGDSSYEGQAVQSFNWASYMANADGTVTVGIDRPDYYNQCWFTDGYFDYVPHFLDGLAAMPQYAPSTEDHMLRSSSPIQEISYQPKQINYRTFDSPGTQKFRLSFTPTRVTAAGKPLQEKPSLTDHPGWSYNPNSSVLSIQTGEREVTVSGE
jgi:hypothetical protein